MATYVISITARDTIDVRVFTALCEATHTMLSRPARNELMRIDSAVTGALAAGAPSLIRVIAGEVFKL
jgi:hypothetical protein